MAGLDENVKLLLHMDGTDTSTTFTDSSDSAHTVTAVDNAQIDTDQSKFGGASGLFDGFGDKLTIPDHADWDFLVGTTTPFTIDFWVRLANKSAHRGFMGQYQGSSNNWWIRWVTGNTLQFEARWPFKNTQIACAWNPSIDTWYHIAITRETDGLLYIYIDGVSQTLTTDVRQGGFPSSLSGDVQIGFDPFNNNYMSGWMDEIRISDIARWTSNFTPPTEAYSSATAEISVTPAGLTFGSIGVGTIYDLDATISSTGSLDLTVSGMTVDNNMYTIISPTSVPFTVAASGSTIATIRYSPTVAQTDIGSFDITSDASIDPIFYVPLYGIGITPEIDLDINSLNFSNIDVGNTSNLTTTISNIGSDNLNVSGLTVDSNVYTIITPTSVPFIISPAGSTEATIQFTPVVAGTVTGNFTITSDDLDESEYIVALSGNGIMYPEIDTSPTSLNYGNVNVFTVSGLTTLISNLGNGDLIVSGLTVDNNVYTIIEPISVPFTIPASGSTIATINFSPVIGGTQTGTFTITSDDLDEPTDTVSLSGYGVLVPEIDVSPTTLAFGNVYIGLTSDLTTTISNTGTSDLTISGLTVDNNAYTITTPTSVPFSISASGSTVTSIRFTPVNAGIISSTFTITSDDSDEPTVAVTLTGTAVEPIAESTINFNLYIDQARDFTSYIDQARNFTSYIDQARNFDLEL